MVNELSSVLGYQGDREIPKYFHLFSQGNGVRLKPALSFLITESEEVKKDENSVSDILAFN